ncbi:MAG TPA: PQQ-dependent dehydrogenase, methanol/ethanol family, partial [Candidatus Binataceae bacterium]|nr:PQQ-dependent dehydrogenase, methanol/ethanol family [Candidatus Binataceae bacterium]
GKDLGVRTWPPGAWKMGGGTVWGWIAYDPDLNLVYYGTANAGPWNSEQRPGDNKWTCTLFARNPDNGHAIWADQLTPHDEFDYDAVNEQILLNIPFKGQTRKVLLHPDRNGYLYEIDRTTGEILSADQYGSPVNTSSGVNLKTGYPIKNPDKSTKGKLGTTVHDICPTASGAKRLDAVCLLAAHASNVYSA